MNGLNTRFDFTAPAMEIAQLGRVHFLAVGGSGMSGVAALLADAGLRVDGCDAAASGQVARLRASGIAVDIGHSAAHLAGVDTLVVSSAIAEHNEELAAARAGGARVLHRAQALAAVMGTRVGVAVAGANGKTTTSAMIVAALRHAGMDPSFAIGSELVDTGTNARLGTGDAFVVEADESDGSFLTYHPTVGVVTNVQPDHLEFYGDVAHVEAAYAAFADTIAQTGVLVAMIDDPGARRLAAHAAERGLRVVQVGESADADLRLSEIESSGLIGSVRVSHRESGRSFTVAVNAPGRHNIENAAVAFAAAWLGVGAPPEVLLEGLAAFPGTRRRFERRGEAGGVVVVDDYAHNGPKVAAVVAGARSLVGDGGRLLVAFQPHLFSRTRDFAADFAAGLAPADLVVLLPIYGAREAPIPGISVELIATPLRERGARVVVAPDAARAVTTLVDAAQPGDLLLTVGAGDVTLLGPQLLAALDAKSVPR